MPVRDEARDPEGIPVALDARRPAQHGAREER
jgi:hypothetical protein